MPIQYFYSEPDNVLCVKVKVPVVLAEVEVQVVVDNIATLPEVAQKIDHIDARLDDFEARPVFVHENGDRWISVIEEEGWERFGWHRKQHRQPVVKKVLISGTLHKQIYYVDKNDHVKHIGEDIPFTKEVTLDAAQPVVDENDVFVQLHHKKIDMRWSLRRGSRLSQTGVMIFRVKVVEERQIFVQVCPKLNERCPRGINLIRDGGLTAWATDTVPIFWSGSNILRFGSALLGADPSEPAALFQTIDRSFPGISPDGRYRLCFDAREIPGYKEAQQGTASYTLTAEVLMFDQSGNIISSETRSWNASQIPDDNFTNLCFNGTTPGETTEVLVRFSFVPINSGNNPRGMWPPPCKPGPPCKPSPPPCVPPPCKPEPPCVPEPPCKPEPPPAPVVPVNTSAVVIDNVTLMCMGLLT
ncbi:DUF3794 domain-containing protein [Desulfallas thermosapovorans]|uniref:Uncharacterized protein DUF3794 n=1 Tax=Desulfallas thermosapovorans DSM 6562 TaxID=1121431 RepID=A0A5S4ZP03_9FIRM|nr:DUF3794 domain-containing protein [Desulfallas thermosapovorans]TYO93368.1 uncharacterized protein DUF3794 [Desulfallas thermosapovorans DSM 6562]